MEMEAEEIQRILRAEINNVKVPEKIQPGYVHPTEYPPVLSLDIDGKLYVLSDEEIGALMHRVFTRKGLGRYFLIREPVVVNGAVVITLLSVEDGSEIKVLWEEFVAEWQVVRTWT